MLTFDYLQSTSIGADQALDVVVTNALIVDTFNWCYCNSYYIVN